MTADTEEQWVKGALPVGSDFSVANVTDLKALLPDCGYKLRSVELEATGRIDRVECDDCPDGEATVIKVTGGGTQLELEDVDEIPEGEVLLRGVVLPPFEGHLQVEVTSVNAR